MSPRYIIIGDDNTIKNLSQTILKKHIPDLPEKVPVYQIPVGEKHKSIRTLENIWNFLVDQSADKKTTLIGFGGGVVTDIVGFAAATYFRGIPWIAVPTSLLAMVDATVGGKTAIDFRGIKNQIGAFHEPVQQIIDTDFLVSLPRKEWSNGMAEVIKIALTSNPSLWDCVASHSLESILHHPKLIKKIVQEAIETKRNIVHQDKLDQKGIRDVLNFGHTVGHAIESHTGMPHGQAVSLGILRECLIGDNTFLLRQQIRMVLEKYGLPTLWKKEWCQEWKTLREYMKHDKKGTRIISLKEIGEAQYIDKPSELEISKLLSKSGCCRIQEKPSQVNNDKTIHCQIPSSKSETNRVLILAALGKGSTLIQNPLLSEDTLFMVEALRQCGVTINLIENNSQTSIHIVGIQYQLLVESTKLTLHIGQSGTCFRFLIGFLTSLTWKPNGQNSQNIKTSLSEIAVTLTGERSLLSRPIQPLTDAVASLGYRIEQDGCGNWTIYIPRERPTHQSTLTLAPQDSSQFLSSLLLSQRDVTIISSLKTKSQSYISLTLACAEKFGKKITATKTNDTITYSLSKEIHENPKEYQVEMDATALIYPVIWGMLQQKNIVVSNWYPDNQQGDDRLIKNIIHLWGGKVYFPGETGIPSEMEHPSIKGAFCQLDKVRTPTNSDDRVLDMDSSDTFMTVSLLSILLPEDKTITLRNIENQNLKESRRIDAIQTTLLDIGMKVDYHHDSLVIKKPIGFQKMISSIKSPVELSSRQDHRLAMTYAILSQVGPINIDDIQCVEKTFPYFFSRLAPKFGCYLQYQNYKTSLSEDNQSSFRDNIASSCIVLVGMPGSGKTFLGQRLATHLGYQWVDTDVLLRQKLGTEDLKKWISEHDWDNFRKHESNILEKILEKHKTKTIISTGGGIIESHKNRIALSRETCVVWLDPSLAKISKHYPSNVYGMTVENLYQKRHRYYQEVCTHRLRNTDIDYVILWLDRLLESSQLHIAQWSTFLCLGQLPANFVWEKEHYQKCHFIEYRPDLFLADIQTDFPKESRVLYTLKDDGDIHEIKLNTIRTAIQEGVSAVDLELHWNTTLAKKDRKQALIIGSCHNDSFEEMKKIVSDGMLRHQPDILKLVGSVESYYDMVSWAEKTYPNMVKILIAGGENGVWTRIINRWLTPICHPTLKVTAVGQLNQIELEKKRRQLFHRQSSQAKGFFLIGDPILQSPGFKYHNDIFQSNTECHPRTYKPYQTKKITEVALLKDKPFFAGASVTCPLKEKVVSLCDWIEPEAQEIGAVNTVLAATTPSGKSFWKGFNTDWVAVQAQLQKCVSGNPQKKWKIAIIGTGGMARACAYACSRENLAYWVICRTKERGKELVSSFPTGKTYLEWNSISQKKFDIILVCVSMDVPVDLRNQDADSFIIEMSYHKNTKHAYPHQNNHIISGMDIFYLQAELQQRLFYKL